jgi:biotin-(acetyl-CoA carboxylase) ligase
MEVTIRDGEESTHGLLSGIDDRGSLLLQTPAGVRSIVSGELTRGPRPI